MALRFDDLWPPAPPLPTRTILREMTRRCGRLWGIPGLADRVRVSYNARLRTTAGRAVLEDARVELNTRLLRENPTHLVPTLVHELAHLAVHMQYGRVAPHGRHWRAFMRAAGHSHKATHALPTAHLKRPRRHYLYLHRCSDCGQTFLARRVRRDLYCKTCGPEMTWDVFGAPATPAGRKLLEELRTGDASRPAAAEQPAAIGDRP